MSNYFNVRDTEFNISESGFVTVSAGMLYLCGDDLTISAPNYYDSCAIRLDGGFVGVLNENEAKLLKAYIKQQRAINKEVKAGCAA